MSCVIDRAKRRYHTSLYDPKLNLDTTIGKKCAYARVEAYSLQLVVWINAGAGERSDGHRSPGSLSDPVAQGSVTIWVVQIDVARDMELRIELHQRTAASRASADLPSRHPSHQRLAPHSSVSLHASTPGHVSCAALHVLVTRARTDLFLPRPRSTAGCHQHQTCRRRRRRASSSALG